VNNPLASCAANLGEIARLAGASRAHAARSTESPLAGSRSPSSASWPTSARRLARIQRDADRLALRVRHEHGDRVGDRAPARVAAEQPLRGGVLVRISPDALAISTPWRRCSITWRCPSGGGFSSE